MTAAARRMSSWFKRRGAASLALGALSVLLVGDNASMQAASGGIDPLEILNLKVKPNVIIVLDSSGSMMQSPGCGAGGISCANLGGDWVGSKMYQSKQVLKQVIQDNTNDVSFMFGQYTQNGSALQQTPATPGGGADRFRYTTTSTDSPSMTTTQLTLQRSNSPGDAIPAPNGGLQSWQDIRAGWNTLYYGEQTVAAAVAPPSIVIDATNNTFIFRERISTATTPYTFTTCTVTLPVASYGTYSTDPQIIGLAATLNAALVAGGPVANRTCVKSGTAAGGPEPSFGLSLTWLGSPVFQFTIAKVPAAAPNRLQIVRLPTLNLILDDLGFITNLPNVAAISATNDAGSASYSIGTTFTGAAVGGTSVPDALCALPIPVQFYTTGQSLATAMQTAMNGCPGRGATANTYTVTYNGATGSFTFAVGAGTKSFQMRWGVNPNNIGGALGQAGVANSGLTTGAKSSSSTIGILYGNTSHDGIFATGVTTYWLNAGRFFNGETYDVLSNGTLCGQRLPTTPTNPPSVKLQQVSSCGGALVGTPVTFTYGGGIFTGNSISCNGYNTRVNLAACDDTGNQVATISPLLALETPLSADGLTLPNYTETLDGAFAATNNNAASGILADGATPIANSLDDLFTVFGTLWSAGQNPGPPILGPISAQTSPKARTIILFVTDGDDTCSGSGAPAALAAAYRGQLLYDPIVGGVQTPTGFLTAGSDSASSVSTYIVGFGSGTSTTYMNYIAWGGSGMQKPNDGTRWTVTPTAGDRALCQTCQDAFIAPTAAALSAALQSIIDTGATSGAFTAQQSITSAVYELAGEVSGPPAHSADDPSKRYEALVPNQFQASFVLPGFQGQLKALQFDPVLPAPSVYTRWEAGAKLLAAIQADMTAITPLRAGAAASQGTFSQLHAGTTDASIVGSNAGLKRRIYTTSRNGTFTLAGPTITALGASPIFNTDLANLIAGTSPGRERLWPPTTTAAATSVAPLSDTIQGLLDEALGLPTDAQITAAAAGAPRDALFTGLQTATGACLGTPLPVNCVGVAPFTVANVQRARREARETTLAYSAGADVVPNAIGNPARITASAGTDVAGDILYKARAWVLAESTLAPPAILGPPIRTPPINYASEYGYYINGVQSAGVSQNGLAKGFGLTSPDVDSLTPPSGPDSRTTLKPVMTVAYLGANDMLHAFRAAPQCSASSGAGSTAIYACIERGGEELWGFVPFDRLGVLTALIKPQTRQNKKFVIAASLRFADMFIDAPGGTASITVGSAPLVAPRGVWRQVLFLGRGKGGKFMTALDVTNRGAYTGSAMATQAPIVYWNRGNPDTHNGTLSVADGGTGVVANTTAEYNSYKKMGETWSTPAIAFVDRTKNITARRPYPGAAGEAGGVPFVAYMGSGYGAVTEGTTFFTLDATSGDVVAAVDVEVEAAAAGVTRSGIAFQNALVSAPVSYSASQIASASTPGHPADPTTRVYIGDLYGRVWKFLSATPNQALLLADVGADQPIGTAGALLSLGGKPHVFMTSGNDSRATGAFKLFGLRDDGDDTTATYGSATVTPDPAVKTYAPGAYLFSRLLGTDFRGTIQPATAFGGANGRVFFGGTRFNEPGTPFAPPPPPCRSSFDSVIFALGAETGGAAYDLNTSGDDSFLVFSNSRKTAIQVIKEPSPPGTNQPGRGRLVIDEGLMGSGSVMPPPPPGVQPKLSGQPAVGLAGPSTKDPRAFAQYSTPRLCQ